MVHPGRFELPTARFVAEYSIQLSYGCILILTADFTQPFLSLLHLLSLLPVTLI